MQVLTGGESQFVGRGGRMRPLSTLVVTSYRLPVVTIGLSPFLQHFWF